MSRYYRKTAAQPKAQKTTTPLTIFYGCYPMGSPHPTLTLPRNDYREASTRLLQGARNHGIELNRILQVAEISLAHFSSTQPLTAHQFIRLLRACKVLLNDEFFGLTQRPAKQGTLALMVDLALGCATLGAAVEKVADFFRIVTDDVEIYCEQQDDEVWLGIHLTRPELDPGHFLTDYWLLYLHRFFSWMTGSLIPVKEVHSNALEGEQRLVFFVRTDWHSAQPRDALLISRKYWTLPVIRTRSEWQENIERMVVGGVLSWPDGTQQHTRQVRALLRNQLTLRQPLLRLQDVAQALNMTVQTLHRHLQHEGTGFQRLLDELRRDVAVDLLSLQHLSVNDVADYLGFSEPRSFTRAFKKWTGFSPSAMRSR